MKKIILLIVVSIFVFGKDLLAKDYNHSSISKMIKVIGGNRITDEMATILSKKPAGVIYLKDAFDKANLYSTIICEVQGEKRHSRDEVDATRHFIGSSILTAYFGANFARELLTAHEKRSDSFNDENYMDLRNNELGYIFGKTIPLKNKTRRAKIAGRTKVKTVRYKVLDTSIEFFTKAVMEKVNNGEFTTLDTTDSACGNPQLYPNY
jgi:hypothetical protein